MKIETLYLIGKNERLWLEIHQSEIIVKILPAITAFVEATAGIILFTTPRKNIYTCTCIYNLIKSV